ncbi:hypothetical protein ACFSOZ_01760 [Mesorhizobium newzealandense]|uniref:Uncharacterized protein n=1 Tax=Mesorhizobium newzealandense TaxID=1300302 RepID=A0ABW4U4F9_9HYPH
MHLIEAGDVLNPDASHIDWKTEKSSSALAAAIGQYATNFNEFDVGAR